MRRNVRKPRHATIEAKFADGEHPDQVHFDWATGELRFTQAGTAVTPLTSAIDFGYQRPNKEKVIRKYPIPTTEIRLHPDYAIFPMDTVYVVDTNVVDDLAVTCVLRGKPEFGADGIKKGIRFRSRPYIVFKGRQEFPEQAAWRAVMSRELTAEDGDTAMVVDADLGRHAAYNARSIAIIGDYFLPQRVQLIYASADVGKEHMLNQVMAKADRAATKMLQRIRDGDVVLP